MMIKLVIFCLLTVGTCVAGDIFETVGSFALKNAGVNPNSKESKEAINLARDAFIGKENWAKDYSNRLNKENRKNNYFTPRSNSVSTNYKLKSNEVIRPSKTRVMVRWNTPGHYTNKVFGEINGRLSNNFEVYVDEAVRKGSNAKFGLTVVDSETLSRYNYNTSAQTLNKIKAIEYKRIIGKDFKSKWWRNRHYQTQLRETSYIFKDWERLFGYKPKALTIVGQTYQADVAFVFKVK